ncbi:hypothetical protein [Streptomyces sp. NBC_00728]|jgi:hypothetical protein|uniref:hypothetical protein n=1 Tax=Streptomyces sp. NBC_00728 TaxID=2903676 RepID=UPI003868047C
MTDDGSSWLVSHLLLWILTWRTMPSKPEMHRLARKRQVSGKDFDKGPENDGGWRQGAASGSTRTPQGR